MIRAWLIGLLAVNALAAEFDVVIRNAVIYDGRGGAPYRGEVAIKADRIAEAAPKISGVGEEEIDAGGMACSPGFINMLSWANESLIHDGRSQSDIRQGVTLEVLGEGESMGPLNEPMRREMIARQGDIKYDVPWTTLGEYLDHIAARGISPNVASFIGATTVRVHELGYENRAPTAAELGRMQDLVRQAMEEGALGVASSLIYAPAFYAKTDELIGLARAAAPYGGIYISHLRSEGNRLFEAFDELLTISREANLPGHIYHLKAAGSANWPKMDELIRRIESARAGGMRITADMYLYTAGATGLDAAMPPWVQEGGYEAWAARLRDPEIRKRVAREMSTPSDEWENFFLGAGSPDKILLVGFRNEKLKPLTGKTLAEVASLRGTSPQETAMDLVIEDGTRVATVYFLMSEENVRKQVKLPWVSFDSDEASLAPEGAFLKSNPHPRAYGNFARLLGKYVRDEKLVPLAEAVRRLTSFPAETLHLKDRGALRPGFFADIVIFDPEKILDHATFEKPHQYSTGVLHVWVNGVQVLRNGEHTGAKPGRVVRGSGWRQNREARKKLPLPGETFLVEHRPAFLIQAAEPAEGKPWVWYAPTLPPYPGREEQWMFEKFIGAGIAIGGMDVGESFGSPAGRELFTSFYDEMRERGYSAKPILLGRSRGGLMTLAWAAENPEKVGGFAGIYPVCNIASYPGVAKAAPAYRMTEDELKESLVQHNPVDRLAILAEARVPFFAIHGDGDAVVPLADNSELLHQRYTALGGSMQLIVPTGQGHNMWTGFFQSQELVDFVLTNAR